ncbi:hypothetical protein ACIA8E_41605, partial [Streptomyces sp. NPDC051664]|uniref:hypothetical protein n=1 Tax=Streptomyces sp. NPDC051664 TaxID=3365668 RepID=UPI0037AE7F73
MSVRVRVPTVLGLLQRVQRSCHQVSSLHLIGDLTSGLTLDCPPGPDRFFPLLVVGFGLGGGGGFGLVWFGAGLWLAGLRGVCAGRARGVFSGGRPDGTASG